MALRTISLGTQANDGTGDPLRSAFNKINQNFAESYREVIGSDRTYYVATTGSDSNDGLTISTPLLNIQTAVDLIANTLFIPSSRTVTVQLADGTYTVNTSVVLRPTAGGGTFIISGNAGNAASVICTISVNGGVYLASDIAGLWNIRNLTLQSSASGSGLVAERGASIAFQNLIFGSGMSSHLVPATNSAIRATGNYTITGSATQHVNSVVGGTLDVTNRTITLTGTPVFTYFCNCGYAATANFAGCTFSGSATGSRYQVFANGVIITGGASATFLPGNAVGTTLTGGVYA
jgi:hypothetical protein